MTLKKLKMASDTKFLFKIARAENFTQKSQVSQYCSRLQVRLRKLKEEFPNFKNLQFVKNTKFSKFSQNFSFYS
jgi:hypothetical protein